MSSGRHVIRVVKTIYLLQHKSYSKKELAMMFQVNVKTIQRDFVEIQRCGFELVKILPSLYYIEKELPEIAKWQEQESFIKKINKTMYYGEITHKTAIIKKAKDGLYFYILKNKKNQIEYISPKYKELYTVRKHIRLAL